MLEFSNGGRYTRLASDLPTSWIGATNVFDDYETTSGDKTKMSVNPWHHCGIAGAATTVDDCPFAIYFDWMRASGEDRQAYAQWKQDLLWYAAYWVNHNIKYDAHIGINYLGLQYPEWLELLCTLTRAKLVDSDRNGARGGYGLDALSFHWLGKDISHYEKMLQPYLGKTNKDYGLIPGDILGEYACQDVLTNRDLLDVINQRLPESCSQVAITEMQLTKELVYLEQNGMQFNKLHMMQEQFKMLNRMSVIDNKLTSIVGRSFRPGVSGDCNEVLCGHYGLPPMGFTKDEDELEEGEDNTPSFDKYAMKAYEALPYGPKEVIQLIVEYRKLDKRNSAFVTPWLEKCIVHDNMQAMIHATYNQIVRTGRMSCSDPNAQQLDDFMASMIIPGEGNSIISTDASQIEFRMIVHYIQDMAAIAAYNNDPDADFHQLVATLCKIARKPAKTINFGTAFGEGMKKVIAQLSANEDIVKQVKDEVDAMGFTDDKMRLGEFTRLIAIRGKHVYETYHKTFPNLKKTTKEAEKACKGVDRRLGLANDSNHYYGYITNLYGRRRHLPYARSRTNFEERDPYDKAWLAFSTINQSSAADLMKERFVYLMRHVIKKLPIKPIAIVHDEMVFVAPDELANDPRTIRDMVGTLENPNANISVPIRWSIGVSNKNWLDAATVVKDGGQSKMLQYDKAELQGLEWART